eukprot:TRINITY_DN5476_c0_g1_i5.p1 TRINITY_DN5476_c0_g1~~TRINITY_DN5476_c0_g1_i5.p1  ORF type:complete len:120 (-),score=17.34 TRINITY_DN5476_c0_g1_i5:304-663(-)
MKLEHCLEVLESGTRSDSSFFLSFFSSLFSSLSSSYYYYHYRHLNFQDNLQMQRCALQPILFMDVIFFGWFENSAQLFNEQKQRIKQRSHTRQKRQKTDKCQNKTHDEETAAKSLNTIP